MLYLDLIKSFIGRRLFTLGFLNKAREEYFNNPNNIKELLELDYYFIGDYNYLNPLYKTELKDYLNLKIREENLALEDIAINLESLS